MNILVVTPFYKQDKNIASVRWTKLVPRLAQKHNIYVETQPIIGSGVSYEIKEDDGIKVARIDQQTGYEKFAVKFFGADSGDDWQTKASNAGNDKKNNSSDSIIRKIKNKCFYSSAVSTAKKIAKRISSDLISKNEKIDVIITSACPIIEMFIGYELKKRLKCKWVCEFRDLPFTSIDTHDRLLQKDYMVKCLNVADAVVSIAPSGKKYLYENKIVNNNDKIHVITNGFSKDDISKQFVKENRTELKIVHTGSLYGGDRKADLLFKAIKLAMEENNSIKFVLECAGGNSKSIADTAKQYGLENIVLDRGFVSREEALKMQQSSDVLLMLVTNRPGSLAAKVFEYMLCAKPVISVTCGNIPYSEETRVVNEIDLGCAVEETDGYDGVKRLSNYLRAAAEKKLCGEAIPFNPDKGKIAMYDHDNLVKQYESLIKNL